MRRRAVQIVGLAALALLAGCATGTRFASDLPETRPLPMARSVDDVSNPPEKLPPPDGYITLHAPDGPIIAREPASRPTSRLDAALLRFEGSPVFNWHLYLLVLAF